MIQLKDMEPIRHVSAIPFVTTYPPGHYRQDYKLKAEVKKLSSFGLLQIRLCSDSPKTADFHYRLLFKWKRHRQFTVFHHGRISVRHAKSAHSILRGLSQKGFHDRRLESFRSRHCDCDDAVRSIVRRSLGHGRGCVDRSAPDAGQVLRKDAELVPV